MLSPLKHGIEGLHPELYRPEPPPVSLHPPLPVCPQPDQHPRGEEFSTTRYVMRNRLHLLVAPTFAAAPRAEGQTFV